MASFLLKAGCDPNSKSHDEQTPLIVAALKGHNKVLTVLLRWPGTRLSEQVQQERGATCTILCYVLLTGAWSIFASIPSFFTGCLISYTRPLLSKGTTSQYHYDL